MQKGSEVGMSETERVINDLNIAKLILCNPQMLTPEMCIRIGQIITSVLALLKEQDPVKPHYNARTNWYECGACHYSMTSGMHCRSEIPATKVRYCANCGFPVNWEGR